MRTFQVLWPTAWGSNLISGAPAGGSEWAKLGSGGWSVAHWVLSYLTPPSALPLTYQGTERCCRTWFAFLGPHRGCLQTGAACRCVCGPGSHDRRCWSTGSRATTRPRRHALRREHSALRPLSGPAGSQVTCPGLPAPGPDSPPRHHAPTGRPAPGAAPHPYLDAPPSSLTSRPDTTPLPDSPPLPGRPTPIPDVPPRHHTPTRRPAPGPAPRPPGHTAELLQSRCSRRGPLHCVL